MSRKSGKKLIIKKKITLSHSSRSKKSESTTLKPKKNTISGKPKVLSKAEQRNLRRSSVNVSKKNIRHLRTEVLQYITMNFLLIILIRGSLQIQITRMRR